MPSSRPPLTEVVAETIAASVRRRRRSSKHVPVDAKQILRDAILPALKEGRLSVFVGAGVSCESGFPNWKQLLDRLADDLVPPELRPAFSLLSDHGSLLVLGRFLKNQVGSPTLFPARIHAALYGPEIDYRRDNPTLRFIVELVLAANSVASRITIFNYNFDDLIQQVLIAHDPKISFDTIVDAASAHQSRSNIRIQHVHGYLPQEPSGSSDTWPEPILAEEGFNALLSDPGAWANNTQSAALTYDDCLFVGLSMADPNLRRLLDICQLSEPPHKPRRYVLARVYRTGDIFVEGSPPMDQETAAQLNAIEADISASIGAVRVPLQNYDDFRDLSEALVHE